MVNPGDRRPHSDTLSQSSWFVIRGSSDARSPARQDRMGHLLSLWWKPVYRYIRASWGKGTEEGRQVLLDYVAAALETDLIGPHGLQNGGFRKFLKQSLVAFLVEKYSQVGKPRLVPPRELVAMKISDAENASLAAELSRFKPDEIFDRQWRRDLVARGLDRLRQELRNEGNEIVYRSWEAFEIHPTSPDAPAQDEAARLVGLPPAEVLAHHEAAQSMLDEFLVETVADYVATRTEVADEMKELFGR